MGLPRPRKLLSEPVASFERGLEDSSWPRNKTFPLQSLGTPLGAGSSSGDQLVIYFCSPCHAHTIAVRQGLDGLHRVLRAKPLRIVHPGAHQVVVVPDVRSH
jgi:hypothetical protein